MTLGRGLDSLIPPQDKNQEASSQNQAGMPQNSVPPASAPAQAPEPALPPAPPESDANAIIPKQIPVPPKAQVLPIPTPREARVGTPTSPRESVGVAQAATEPDMIRGDEAIFHIEVERIKPNPHQPRRNFNEGALHDLASSIREFGVIQPLVVSKVETETPMGTLVEYQLIAGERRLMASKLAGLPRVPVIIRNVPLEREKLELAIIENLQREDLNPIESARAFARLQDEFRLTQREVAARLGKSRESIANTLRLLNLPTPIQDAIGKKQISESQGRLLLAVSDMASQEKFFQELLRENLSVRELKSRIRKETTKKEEIAELVLAVDPELEFIKKQLESFLGTPVLIQRSGENGKIVIEFYSEEELRGILQKIKPEEIA